MKALVAMILTICFTVVAVAAPIPSRDVLPTAPTTAAPADQLVAERLAALGMSDAQIQIVMKQLDAQQLDALAAHLTLIEAGGTIQGSSVKPPISYVTSVFQQLGIFLSNVFGFVFSWKEPTGHFSAD